MEQKNWRIISSAKNATIDIYICCSAPTLLDILFRPFYQKKKNTCCCWYWTLPPPPWCALLSLIGHISQHTTTQNFRMKRKKDNKKKNKKRQKNKRQKTLLSLIGHIFQHTTLTTHKFHTQKVKKIKRKTIFFWSTNVSYSFFFHLARWNVTISFNRREQHSRRSF